MIQATGCNALQVRFEMPVEMRYQYLGYEAVMNKARPVLEKIARDREVAGGGDSDKDEDWP